mgnify:CR=1 FL=1
MTTVRRILSIFLVLAAAGGLVAMAWNSIFSRPCSSSTGAAMESKRVNKQQKRFKILHVMSYHASWEWTQDQFRGFKDALKGLDVEYKVYELDTKRRSTKEWKEKVGREARALIESWKPDLVYTSDDNAQELVTKYFLNREIPFVFSAVNADPETYGFTRAGNVTGVLEREHSVETVNLLRNIAPWVRRIAVIVDDDPTWLGVVKRMKAKAGELPGVEFVAWDVIRTFTEYKRKILEYQNRVEALALLGIHTFKGENGENVPWQTVLRWTAENSRLPDFSFWKDRVAYGTLCVVYISGYEQGLAAGKIARGILAEGKSPADYPIRPTIKGRPRLSLARAKKLGLKIKSSLLLSAEVVSEFAWEKK